MHLNVHNAIGLASFGNRRMKRNSGIIMILSFGKKTLKVS